MTVVTWHCGTVAIIGRPNVGKSTLLNKLLGKKVSITARKPQTTRHNILGIYTQEPTQILLVDTPGIHSGQKRVMNKQMNRSAKAAIDSVDCALWLVDVNQFTAQDAAILQWLDQESVPVILGLNKIDRVKDKDALLAILQQWSERGQFAALVPISAQKGKNLEALMESLREYLHKTDPIFDPEQVTDRGDRFLATEIIREKIIRFVGEEVPYSAAVKIDTLKNDEKLTHIHATIWVESEGQKKIIIGKGGDKLKTIGSQARKDLQALFERKVYLNLWVKVKANWPDNSQALQDFGIDLA